MLDFARMRLADYSRPRISYVLSVMDQSVPTGYEHESWKLGDLVTVADKELGLTVKTRVVRREYNLGEPWNTVIELSTKLRELEAGASADGLDGADGAAGIGANVRDLVVFNHLLTSRGYDGFTHWDNDGFTLFSMPLLPIGYPALAIRNPPIPVRGIERLPVPVDYSSTLDDGLHPPPLAGRTPKMTDTSRSISPRPLIALDNNPLLI